MYTTQVRKHRDSAVSYLTSNVRKSKTSVGSYTEEYRRKSKSSVTSYSDPNRTSRASYPTPLPDVPRRSTPLKVFKSIEEKITLENAVRILKRHHRKHAAQMTLSLFTEHEYLIEAFRLENGSLDIHALHNHMLYVLDFLEQCIRLDFCNHNLLRKIQNKHQEMKIGKMEIMTMAQAIKQYWRAILANHVSETYFIALDNVFDRIFMYL